MFIPAFTFTSDFLSSISPGWVVIFLVSYRPMFTILSWLDLQAFNISILKIFKLIQNYLHRTTDIKFRKSFGKFSRSYSEGLSKCGEISLQEYVSEGISHPVFYCDLVYKLRRSNAERISSFSSLRSRK